ncbi:hypothetical protein [Streptomyces sp. TLI_171]|uniref:hypothetical protein n=1 Tax=Streptomyces sp. TLI_171 TaxID=1938859 RepID=UPI0011C494CE|nr:hypothetical protein [Streptomyces sp. TLI_171]
MDLAAARLYLIGSMQELDALLCAGAPGTHVGRGRCVTAGLRRLPSYRGAAWARVSIGGSGGAWFAGRDTVDDWGWTTAFTRADGSAEGDTDLLIWSATARRTAVLDRDFPTRVVFLPGTRFQVLDVREDGPRRTVLLREVAVAEPDAPGVEPGALSPRAAVAVAGLDRAATAWSEAPGRPPGRPASALPVQMRAPGVLPGVMDVPAIGTSISG